MEVNLEFSWGHRRIAKSDWERPGRERAAGRGPPALGSGRPPQSVRNGGLWAARVLARSRRVRCQGTDRLTEAGATERMFSPPGRALGCSPAPNTSRAASLGPPSRSPSPTPPGSAPPAVPTCLLGAGPPYSWWAASGGAARREPLGSTACLAEAGA